MTLAKRNFLSRHQIGLLTAILMLTGCDRPPVPAGPPGEWAEPRPWVWKSPEEVGLIEDRLDELASLVGGHGCVVRDGYMVYSWGDSTRPVDVASACKPVISTLLMIAVQEGLIRGVDEPVVRHDGRLRALDRKNRRITWRHLASQTSGYGLEERPGEAWAYNDYALAYYYDVLTENVFRKDGEDVLMSRIGRLIGFEDSVTFHASLAGRLGISARDFARFGVLFLQRGFWDNEKVLREDLIELMLSSAVPPDLERTSGRETAMLPNQRTIGGRGKAGKNLLEKGPGHYSFNWWINQPESTPKPMFSELPPDTYWADGHVHRHMLWVIPEYDMVVVWLNTNLSGDAERTRKAAGLIRESVGQSI